MPKSKKKTALHGQRGATAGDLWIGQQLRARRLEMHVSQSELADRIGVSFQQIQKYEKGVNRVAPVRLAQIAQVLETNIDYFLGDLDGKKAPKPSKVHAFLATRDGIDINEAMIKLESSDLRRAVIDLARRLGNVYGEAEA
jgi:transcriptional regulator with XRE-family HTH domain